MHDSRALVGARFAVLAIDIPIGLTDSGPRACDALARRELGSPRCSSVFPAPVRAALSARTRAEADAITRRIDGRGVGAQSFNIVSKIRETDEALSPRLQRRCFEAHPEVSFRHWIGALASKKSREGAAARARAIDARWPGARARVRAECSRKEVADDDIHDAFALLWTAERILAGESVRLGGEVDARGLRMEINY